LGVCWVGGGGADEVGEEGEAARVGGEELRGGKGGGEGVQELREVGGEGLEGFVFEDGAEGVEG
jgi:hypothetical protein